MEKDEMSEERPSRPSRQPKKKQRAQAEAELSESDEYAEFNSTGEISTVIVGEETETSSAVQSIQQVNMRNNKEVIVLLPFYTAGNLES